MKKNLNINDIIDGEASATVGKICKRLEVLQKQDIPYSKKEKLFKDLVKELIYEGSRSLKKLLKLYSMGYKKIESTEFERHDK